MIEIILFLVLLSISVLLIKRRFEHRPDWAKKSQIPQPVQPTYASRFFGAVSSLLIPIVIVVALLALAWLWFWPSPSLVYDSGQLAKLGNCQDRNGYVQGNECTINLPAFGDWKEIDVVQPGFNDPGGPAEIGAMTVNVGDWSFSHQFGKGIFYVRPNMRLVTILYGGSQVAPGYGEITREGFSPHIFIIRKSWGKVEVILNDGTGRILGNKYIASSNTNLVKAPIQGQVSISGNLKIKEVRIYN